MLADSLADDLSVQIVRVDATKNDIIHPKVRINAFPTFYFFSVGDQDEPIEYDGERTLEAILKFIRAFKSSTATKAAAAAAVTAGAAAGTGTVTETETSETRNQLQLSPPLTQGGRSRSKSDSTSDSEDESEGDSDDSSDEGEAAVTGSDEDMGGDSASDTEPHAL